MNVLRVIGDALAFIYAAMITAPLGIYMLTYTSYMPADPWAGRAIESFIAAVGLVTVLLIVELLVCFVIGQYYQRRGDSR